MTCCEFQRLFCALSYGELSPEQSASARRHLECCPGCAREWEDFHVLVQLARRLPPEPLPPALARQLRADCVRWMHGRRARRDLPPA